MTENSDSLVRWRGLFRVGAVASYVVSVLLIAEVAVFAVLPPIGNPTQLLADFNKNWLLGLLRFDLLGMLSYLLFIPVILSICLSLGKSQAASAVIAAVLFAIGISVFFATNTGFSVLSLSSQYRVANSPAERASIVSACRAMITLFRVNAFVISYVIVSGSWLMLGVSMLKSVVFRKSTSWAGILAGASGLIAEIAENVSKTLRWLAIGLYFAAIVFLLFWVFRSGIQLQALVTSSGLGNKSEDR